jgi:hypothetical protein
MSADQLCTHDDAEPSGSLLLEKLLRSQAADAAAPEPFAPGLRAVDAGCTVVEQAKGALMLPYGIDSFQAFAVLVRWARVTRTPLRKIAQTFLHGICEGNPQTETRQWPLIRWLEDQLRLGVPELA